MSTQLGENSSLVNDFLIGFPFEYSKKEPFGGTTYQITTERFYPDYSFAFDSQGNLTVLSDVGLGRLGFYGAKVIFPQPVNISTGHPYSFTIIFVFSNLLQATVAAADTSRIDFNMSLPLYPSLIQNASSCVVKVFLPNEATYTAERSSLYEETLFIGAPKDFNVTSLGSRQILNVTQSPLTSFTYEPGWLIFSQRTTVSNKFQMIEANEVIREITLDEWGRISCSNPTLWPTWEHIISQN